MEVPDIMIFSTKNAKNTEVENTVFPFRINLSGNGGQDICTRPVFEGGYFTGVPESTVIMQVLSAHTRQPEPRDPPLILRRPS